MDLTFQYKKIKLQKHFLKENVGAYLCGSGWEDHHKHSTKGETMKEEDDGRPVRKHRCARILPAPLPQLLPGVKIH